eukprot:scaffold25106_cov17-Tisochrysis_lutea.AAC.1
MHRTGLTSLEKGAPGQSSSAWCCPSLLGGWGSSPLDQQIEGEVSVETRPRESPPGAQQVLGPPPGVPAPGVPAGWAC